MSVVMLDASHVYRHSRTSHRPLQTLVRTAFIVSNQTHC